MSIHLQKIILIVLPLAGLLLTAPLAFAHDSWAHGWVHDELSEEHKESHEALDAEARVFHRQPHSRRALRHEQRRLAPEHQVFHEDLEAQHEDYHDGDRYRNWFWESPAVVEGDDVYAGSQPPRSGEGRP